MLTTRVFNHLTDLALHSPFSQMTFGKTREVINAQDLQIVERFRYRIYIEELKKPLPWADHLERRLPDRDDLGAHHFICEQGFIKRQMNGYLRMHLDHDFPEIAKQIMPVPFDHQVLGVGCYVSKFMVLNSLRGLGASHSILISLYNYFRQHFDVKYQISHCNPKLVRLYEKMGLRQFGDEFYDPLVGRQVPMVLLLSDQKHLKTVGSFFYKDSLKYSVDENEIARQKEVFGFV